MSDHGLLVLVASRTQSSTEIGLTGGRISVNAASTPDGRYRGASPDVKTTPPFFVSRPAPAFCVLTSDPPFEKTFLSPSESKSNQSKTREKSIAFLKTPTNESMKVKALSFSREERSRKNFGNTSRRYKGEAK